MSVYSQIGGRDSRGSIFFSPCTLIPHFPRHELTSFNNQYVNVQSEMGTVCEHRIAYILSSTEKVGLQQWFAKGSYIKKKMEVTITYIDN